MNSFLSWIYSFFSSVLSIMQSMYIVPTVNLLQFFIVLTIVSLLVGGFVYVMR